MTGPILLALRLLLAASLFAFLGWSMVLLWRELSAQSKFLAARKIPPLNLVTQTDENAPKILSYTQGEIVIGRDAACQCKLDDETISVRHAMLSYHHSQWWVEDLDSTNGTHLNDMLLSTPTVVISGDKIHCGHTTLTLVFGNEEQNHD
jgi:pSer/pThr/pTyr-binding forkhead associated (FHA) protein